MGWGTAGVPPLNHEEWDCTVPLAAFRRIWIGIWAQASSNESVALSEALASALSPHGEVLVTPKGPCWRTREMLEFLVFLVPSGTTMGCRHALEFTLDPDGMWRDWERPRDGGVFLHPAVYGVQVSEEEAAAPPLFKDSDIVVNRDCADARAQRLVGAEAVVHSASYDADQPENANVPARGSPRGSPTDERAGRPALPGVFVSRPGARSRRGVSRCGRWLPRGRPRPGWWGRRDDPSGSVVSQPRSWGRCAGRCGRVPVVTGRRR